MELSGASPTESNSSVDLVAEVAAATTHLQSLLGEIEVGDLDDVLLTELVQPLHQLRCALDGVELPVIHQLETSLVTIRTRGLNTGSYLAAQRGIRPGTASRWVANARYAHWYPQFHRRLASGTVSLDHLTLLGTVTNLRNLGDLQGLQRELIELAQHLNFTKWAEYVRYLAQLLDDDGVEPHDPTPDRLRVTQHVDATVNIEGTFSTIDGTCLREMLERHAERVLQRLISERHQRSGTDDPIENDRICGPLPKRNELLATALIELVRAGHTSVTTSPQSRTPETDLTIVSIPEPNADLLNDIGLAGHYEERLFYNMFGVRLDPFTLHSRITPARITRVLLDRHGAPTHVAKQLRYATTEQRRAMIARNGHQCSFPGCHRIIAFGHAHHVTHYSAGGHTDLANLIMVCPAHHRLTHSSGWKLEQIGDQELQWTSPTGQRLKAQAHGRVSHPPPSTG